MTIQSGILRDGFDKKTELHLLELLKEICMSWHGWKAFEQRVARFFHSERTPLSGACGKQTASDTLHPALFIEAKLRSKFAICALFRKVEERAKAENKIPVMALQDKFHAGWLLLCRPEDVGKIASWAANYENLPDVRDEESED